MQHLGFADSPAGIKPVFRREIRFHFHQVVEGLFTRSL